jgi:hypothetical protein
MSAEVWGIIGAFAGAWLALLAVGAAAFFWLMSAIHNNGRENRAEIHGLREENRAENRELRAELRAEAQERRADMQRFFEALYRHRHDPGGVIYMPGEDD